MKFFIATGGSWICRFLVLNFVLFAFLELGVIEHLVLLARQLVMWMILIIPTTPGGAGLAEMLFTDFLADIAGTGTLILTMAFIWRGLSSYLYLIIGSILLPRWLVKTRKKWLKFCMFFVAHTTLNAHIWYEVKRRLENLETHHYYSVMCNYILWVFGIYSNWIWL